MGNRQLGQIKRRPQHQSVHVVVFLHGEVFDGVDVLNTGNIGQVFNSPNLAASDMACIISSSWLSPIG